MRAFIRTLLAAMHVLALLACAQPASALDPGRGLRQFHHTAWTIADGAPPDIWALAQSRDGFLWLGTGAGLYRFDGIRFEPVLPRAGDAAPSGNITALLATPAGDIWIGYVTGDVARYRGGRLQVFDTGLRGNIVYDLTQGADGAIWAAMRDREGGGLVRFAGGRWQRIGADAGLPPVGVTSVLAARSGDVWITAPHALFVRRTGKARFEKVAASSFELATLAQSPDGRIWLSGNANGQPFTVEAGSDARPASLPDRVQPLPAAEPAAARIIFDRDGAMWGTYLVGGVFRITGNGAANPARAEKFALADGLSADIARPVLEDREGNIWVGTNLGLDRFRAANVVAAPGLPVTSRLGYRIGATGVPNDHAVLVAAGTALYRADPQRPAILLSGLPATAGFLQADGKGGAWVGMQAGLGRLDADGRFTSVRLPAAARGRVSALLESERGNVCIAVLQKAIYCRVGAGWQQSALRLDAAHPAPLQMVRDSRSRLWFDFGNRLAMLESGRLRTFSAADGLSIGKIGIIAVGRGDVLVGGDFGLARFDGKRFTTFSSADHPVLARIAGILQTARGDIWINSIKGVVRIAGKDLTAAASRPRRAFKYRLFDLADGLPGVAQQDSDAPTTLEGSDGRLWFVTSHGVAWIDPAHLVYNPLPPPVSIRALATGGREYENPARLTLPEGASTIRIDYTAASLSNPQRVQFRYRLEGVDDGWVDPGGRRQAFYTKLAPGAYQFRVIASNNDGVWNTTGATLDFVIPPTFVQSRWFAAMLVIGLFGLLWLLYSLRLRQMADRMRGRLEERITERERIARELHDTLLQGFQGLVFRFQAATQQIPPGHPARALMDESLDRADEVLAEGRDRVVDLRGSPATTDISKLFAATAAELLPESGTGFRITVEGRPRRLHPIMQEEVLRIGQEAISNAARHAKARLIEVSLLYRARDFTAHFRDDGAGIDPDILARGGRDRHFGLIGMRERARKIRAELEISSLPGAGTEITLSMRAAIAYVELSRPKRRWFGGSRYKEG